MLSPRDKRREGEKSRVNLLHSGVRRSLLPADYTKIFTKIPIQHKRPSFPTATPLCEPSTLLANDNSRLRALILELQTSNAQLASSTSKQLKLQVLLQKRLGSDDPYQLTLQKAMEIKLMLEAETLQELLTERQLQLQSTLRQLRQGEERIRHSQDQPEVELYAILAQREEEVSAKVAEKERTILLQKEKVVAIREKTQRLKEGRKGREEELRQLQKQLERGRECLPTFSKSTEDNDSGLYGTQHRAKNTQTLEREIERLREQRISWESDIQQLMQEKVKEKLLVLKAIHQLQARMPNSILH